MSWRERDDDGDDHDLGLNLSLQLKCPSQKSPQHKPSLNGIYFQSSSAPRPNTRLDMNVVSSSSPDSTISSGNGKRSEREETGLEPHSASSEGRAGDDSAARKKLRLTKEQAALLEETFKHQNTLNQNQKVALANQLNLQTRQVEVWFQNRRARTKFKKTEVDYAYLKRVYENLTDENCRLQKEVAELKALKYCPQCERLSMGSKLSPAPPSASGTSTQRHVSTSGPFDQTTPKASHWLLSKLRGD